MTISTVTSSEVRISASSRREAGSRLDDGSSRTRISGSIASTVATATRRRWPKLRWCGGRSAKLGHPDLVERRQDARVELGPGQAEVGRAEGDVVAHRGHEELVVGVLEDDADAAPHLLQVLPWRPAARRPRTEPAPALEDAVEVQNERGLAGPVGPEQGDPLATVDVQVDAVERLVAVGVGVGQALDVEDRGAHRCTAGSPPVTGIRPV